MPLALGVAIAGFPELVMQILRTRNKLVIDTMRGLLGEKRGAWRLQELPSGGRRSLQALV